MAETALYIADLPDTLDGGASLAGSPAGLAAAEDERDVTTLAVGEEGDDGPTTKAIGEEGDDDGPTTLAVGEEGDDDYERGPTTLAVGEEGDG